MMNTNKNLCSSEFIYKWLSLYTFRIKLFGSHCWCNSLHFKTGHPRHVRLLTVSPSSELFVPDCLSNCNYCSVNLFCRCGVGGQKRRQQKPPNTVSNNNESMHCCVIIMTSSSLTECNTFISPRSFLSGEDYNCDSIGRYARDSFNFSLLYLLLYSGS